MNDTVLAFIRYALTAAAMFGAGRGWFSADAGSAAVNAIAAAIPAVVAAAMAIWGGWKSTRAQRVASVQASPTEHVVTTDPALKQAVPDVTIASPAAATVTVPVPKAA